MQERYARVIFSSALAIQLLAAIWWASALNASVQSQQQTLNKVTAVVDSVSTKVALLELRTLNLEEISRETRDIVRNLEKK